MRLRSDLLEVLLAAAEGRLGAATQLQWSPDKALTVRHLPTMLSSLPDVPIQQRTILGCPCQMSEHFAHVFLCPVSPHGVRQGRCSQVRIRLHAGAITL